MLDILDKDFKCLKYAQIAEGNHGKRTRRNQENDVRTTWKYVHRSRNYK